MMIVDGSQQACRESKVSLEQAEAQMLEFIQRHTEKGTALLAGNTVHADKEFLAKFMPRFMAHLHYRIVVNC